MLARTIWGVHILVVIVLATAWSLPWTGALWTAVVVYPLVHLHWWALGNRCFLSILEQRLRGSRTGSGGRETRDAPLHFVAEMLSRVLGRPISRAWGDLVAYAFVWGGFAIASMRLYARG